MSAAPTPAGSSVGGLIEAIRPARPMVAAMLEQASALHLQGKELVIRFSATMEAVKRQVETKESLSLIGQEAERLCGRPVKVRIELEAAPTATAEEAVAPSPAAAARPPDARSPAQGDVDGLLEEARREPGVQKLMDAFGAHVVGIQRQDRPDKNKTRTGRSKRPPEYAPGT